ncbi:nucleolar MIF4G domain-containing protein 1 isoform X1 [Photinus pyralis]|uniref:nucleolar MIF4G domain-containing protein 1 isoform X1 n=1 Tax=Photinus pyralis TaxID=7054 RepID=UPI001266FA26|nr:nucleolar MIF4G domain-containing protein 1 isoform X1 [Photinus pyralis]
MKPKKFSKLEKQTKPKSINTPKTRKQIRKELRKEKKARKHDYYTNRNQNGKYVLLRNKPSESSPPLEKKLSKDPKEFQAITSDEIRLRQLNKEKREQEKLRKQMEEQRKEQLLKANNVEDRNIKRLEKQLHLNKRKSKTTPKSFLDDGLDYLLEVCDSSNMQAAVAAEQQFTEVNDDFDEDFQLMANKTKSQMTRDTSESEEDDATMSDGGDNSEEEDQAMSDDVDDEEEDVEAMSDGSDDKEEEFDLESGDPKSMDMEESEQQEEGKSDTWEDIYGRLRGKDGEIVTNNEAKYIPPAIRAKMEGGSSDKKRAETLRKLQRQIKGLLNRLAESNMHSIASQIEDLYMNNSRNDMNDTLTTLLFDSLVTPVLTPERLMLEHMLLVTILHANVGTEVGAHFLQMSVKRFHNLFDEERPVENKMLDNGASIIAHLYDYKVIHAQLIYEMLNKLSGRFTETDIECILLILKSVGFSLRKDDPLELKKLILSLQERANNVQSKVRDNARVKFMLDILLAIKNNNMSKIPNYDTSYADHLKKLLKSFVRKGSYVTTLNISLEDLLKADQYGKWWVVGSAWSGKTEDKKEAVVKQKGYSRQLLDLARKQRMNTDARRNIFCIIMSAEDYLEAFEQLLHLGLKNQQEREIIHVILHCCLQEKAFNPYYALLAQKFCEYERKFQMTIKYSIWDKLKALTECSASQLSNLAKLLTHLFLERGLAISTLKVVQFSELDKITLRFIRQILIGVLLCEEEDTCKDVFRNVAQSEKLKLFRESLKLFIQHFLVRNLKSDSIPEKQKSLLRDRAGIVNGILSSSADKKLIF